MLAEAQITLETVEDGADGVGITSELIRYASSDSGSTVPVSGWTATMPDVSQGDYLWTRTIFVYSDGTESSPVYSVAYQGVNGTGGSGGESSPAIVETIEEWAIGTDDEADAETWSDAMPRITGDQVLWKRLRLVWNDDRSDTFSPSSAGQKSTMINELVTFRNTIGSVDDNGEYTLIDGGTIKAATIGTSQLKANAITSAKIKAEAITADKLSVSSLKASKITVGGAIMFTPTQAFKSLQSKGKTIAKTKYKDVWVNTGTGLKKKKTICTNPTFSVDVLCEAKLTNGNRDKRWYPIAITSVLTNSNDVKITKFSIKSQVNGAGTVTVEGERGKKQATLRVVMLFARIKD